MCDTLPVDRNSFILWIDFEQWRSEPGSEIWDIDLDTVRITLNPPGGEVVLWSDFVHFSAFKDPKKVAKVYSFYEPDFTGDPEYKMDSFEIPKGVDTITVTFDAFLRSGTLARWVDDIGIDRDSIVVDATVPVDTVNVSFRMYRYDKSMPTWKWLAEVNKH